MPRVCTVCTHPERDPIDRALVEGESAPRIAAKYRVSDDAVTRHRAHLPRTLVKAQDAQEAAKADDLLREVRALRSKAYQILKAAESQGDYRTALAGIREARGCLELLARLLGELDDRPQVNIILSPEWAGLRARIVAALTPYPEAKAAIVEALGDGR